MSADSTIRVRRDVRDRLNELSRERGVPVGDVVAGLLAEAEEADLLDSLEQHYRALRSEPEAWAAYRSEIEAWDATAGDALTE
jgi:hypothetical protein